MHSGQPVFATVTGVWGCKCRSEGVVFLITELCGICAISQIIFWSLTCPIPISSSFIFFFETGGIHVLSASEFKIKIKII